MSESVLNEKASAVVGIAAQEWLERMEVAASKCLALRKQRDLVAAELQRLEAELAAAEKQERRAQGDAAAWKCVLRRDDLASA
jgi:hypothetical protein